MNPLININNRLLYNSIELELCTCSVGLSDPYLIVKYGGQEVCQTPPINKTLNPQWNCNYTLSAPAPSVPIVLVSQCHTLYDLMNGYYRMCYTCRSAGIGISSPVMISWALWLSILLIYRNLRSVINDDCVVPYSGYIFCMKTYVFKLSDTRPRVIVPCIVYLIFVHFIFGHMVSI